MVAQLVDVAANRLKLICSGRVVNETDMLDKQNIKNGSQVMVLSIATDQDSFQVSFITINCSPILIYC